ncbi:hypothetical protein ABPG74_021863 [Tetrahymena malaccensis]
MQNQIIKYLVNLEKDNFTKRLQESIKFIQQAIYYNSKFLDNELELSICYSMFFRGLIYQLNQSHDFLNTDESNIATQNICLIPKEIKNYQAKGMSFIILIKAIQTNQMSIDETSEQLQFKAQQGIQEIYDNKYDSILDKYSPDSNKVFISLAFYKDFVDVIIKSKLNLDYDKQNEWNNILDQINKKYQLENDQQKEIIQQKIIKIQLKQNKFEQQINKEDNMSNKNNNNDNNNNNQIVDNIQNECKILGQNLQLLPQSNESTSDSSEKEDQTVQLNQEQEKSNAAPDGVQKKVIFLKKSLVFRDEEKVDKVQKEQILNLKIKHNSILKDFSFIITNQPHNNDEIKAELFKKECDDQLEIVITITLQQNNLSLNLKINYVYLKTVQIMATRKLLYQAAQDQSNQYLDNYSSQNNFQQQQQNEQQLQQQLQQNSQDLTEQRFLKLFKGSVLSKFQIKFLVMLIIQTCENEYILFTKETNQIGLFKNQICTNSLF